MVIAILHFLLISLFGYLLTYFFDRESKILFRAALGVLFGQVIFGYTGFILASLFKDLTPALTWGTVFLCFFCIFLLLRRRKDIWKLITKDVKTLRKPTWLEGAVSLGILCFFILVLRGAMFVKSGEIYTTTVDNYADLTLHLGIVYGFMDGHNYPPMHPDFAGTKLTYPFISDFIAAMISEAGPGVETAFWIQNIISMLALCVIMYQFAYVLTKRRLASFLSLLLLIFSGGLGWLMIFKEIPLHEKGVLNFFLHLSHDYTSYLEDLRWVNPVVYWFIPMRSMILGIPLAIAVFIFWWKAGIEKTAKHPFLLMTYAGVITGLLPLTHSHSYLVLIVMGVLLSICFRNWKAWMFYFIPALLIGIPQAVWLKIGSLVDASTYFGFIHGWNPNAAAGIIEYWFYNTGFFIPLTLIALVWPRFLSGNAKLFIILFHICFIVPNFIKFAPWEWDNVKILAYWYIVSIPAVGLVLDRLWHAHIPGKIIGILLIFTLTFSAGLDIWRSSSEQNNIVVFDKSLVDTASQIKQHTSPRSVILTALLHNNSVLLTGRQSYMGYTGRVWTHGLHYFEREHIVKQIYTGSRDADQLIESQGIDYILVAEQERVWSTEQNIVLNETYFSRFPVVAKTPDGYLFKTSKK